MATRGKIRSSTVGDLRPRFYAPPDIKRQRRVRLFRVFSDKAGGWQSRLRNIERSIIARATPREEGGWVVQFVHRNGHATFYSHETTRRAALIQCGAASYRACDLGWNAVLMADMDLILAGKPIAHSKKGPDVIPVGAATALVSVSSLSAAFRTGIEQMIEFLKTIECPTTTAPNGVQYVSLWVFELCLLTSQLQVDPHSAAELLVKGQTVYKAARRAMALERLSDLASHLLRES